MINIKNILTNSSLARYIATGLLAFLVEIAAISLLTWLGLSPLAAVAVAFWIGLSVAFLLQKFFAFKNTERRRKYLLWQTASYVLLVLINYIFTLLFVSLTEPMVGIIIARAAALGITTAWNYALYRWVIFDQSVPSKIQQLFHRARHRFSLHRLTVSILLVLPILIYTSPLLMSGANTILSGDYDMQVQMTEAAKISILEFKEFPFWNPWVSGGVPLFADPQFGLLTPQTIYSLFLPSPIAWKLSIITYFIVGFFAMKTLLSCLTDRSRDSSIRNSLLAYIWIFGSFFTLRSNGGHFTFLLFALAPLAVYFYFNLSNGRRYVIYLVLLIGYLFGSALHYSSILIVLLLLLISVVDVCITSISLIKSKSVRQLAGSSAAKRFLCLIVSIAGGIALVLPRVYLSLEYLRDSSVDRSWIREPFLGLAYGLDTLVKPYGTYIAPRHALFSAFEASTYIGTITFFLFLIALAIYIYILLTRSQRLTLESSRYVIILVFVVCVAFIIGMGGKPFELLRELPVMSSMRVSTRYFIICALALVSALAILLHLIGKSNIINRRIFTFTSTVLLGAAALQVAAIDYSTLMQPTWHNNHTLIHLSSESEHSTPPRSEALWGHREPHYYALTEATMKNHAQIIADNALVDTRILPSARCDEDEIRFNCRFVLSNNATVISWSPNSFTLKRIAAGPIHLNMNTAAHWTVNGKYVFADQKTVDANSTFTIDDSTIPIYIINYLPLPKLLK